MLKYLLVFMISMVPLIELRGAIPVGMSSLLGESLPIIPLYIVCIIGNMLPVPFIYLFARKVLMWGANKKIIGKFFTWCLEKGEKGGKKLQEKAGKKGYIFKKILIVIGWILLFLIGIIFITFNDYEPKVSFGFIIF